MSGRRWLFGALDQTGRHPGPAQDMRVVELQPVQIELDRAPRVRGQQLGEVVGQLLLGQGLDLVIEALADAPDGTRVGVDGLGLQTLELEVLEVGLVLSLEMLREVGHDGKSSMGGTDSRARIGCVNLHHTSQIRSNGLLRVAASSNPALKRDDCAAA